MQKITNRLKLIIECNTSTGKKFKELEGRTGIPAGTWRTWWNRGTAPSGEMIETASKAWPQYAFWLATGLEDSAYGHVSPADAGYPNLSLPQPNSAAYFSALRDCQVEATRLGELWFSERFGEMPDDSDKAAMPDKIYRSIDKLGLAEDTTRRLNEAQRRLAVAEKLRRAEILLNSEMPVISYDETESLGSTIQKLLEVRISATEEEERKAVLQEKLGAELERLERHKEFSAQGTNFQKLP